MKFSQFTLLIFICLNQFLFCSTTQSVDKEGYFQATTISKIDQELIQKPFEIYLASKHPTEGNRFRYLNYEECQKMRTDIQDLDRFKEKRPLWHKIFLNSSFFIIDVNSLAHDQISYCLKFEDGSHAIIPIRQLKIFREKIVNKLLIEEALKNGIHN